ncbi:MAG: hypothetical protein AAGI01_12580, partial [Myxococcota bacterium]
MKIWWSGALGVGALMCTLASAPAFAQDSPEVKEAPDKLRVAREAYDAGEWDRAIGIYEEVYKSSPKRSVRRAEAALEWSTMLWEQGSYKQAKRRAEDALSMARDLKLDHAIGRLLLTLGHIETSQGKLGRASKTFGMCVTLAKEQNDDIFGALCRMNLGLVRRIQGKPGITDAQLRADIAALERAGTPWTTGSALVKTSELYERAGDWASAKALLGEADEQFRRAGSLPAKTRNELRVARVEQKTGQWDSAKGRIQTAIPRLKKMNNRPSLVTAYGLLGDDAKQRGDRDGAASSYATSLQYAKSIGSPQLMGQSNLALCELHVQQPGSARADSHCNQAASAFAKVDVPELEARALLALASSKQRAGEYKAARDLYVRGIDVLTTQVAEPLQDRASIASHRANLCQVNQRLELTGALLSCNEALEALRALPDSAAEYAGHIAATHYTAGFAAQKEGRIKQSLRHFERAAQMYGPLGERLREADARLRMGLVYSVVMDGEDLAVKSLQRALDAIAMSPASREVTTMRTQILTQLGQVYMDRKQWNDASATLERLVAHAGAAR